MKAKLLFVIPLLVSVLLVASPNSFAQQVPFANVPFDTANIPEPVPPPAAVRDFFDLDPFYQQWINVRGFPVLASAEVSPYAVKEVAWLIHNITRHRPAVLQVMAENKVRFSIIGHSERTTDIPELRIFPEPHFFYDIRNRGGYCPRCKTVFAPEETVLDEGWYSVTIHEFAHAFHEAGLNTIDASFDNRLKATYNAAMARGLWQNTYASTNFSEYWAQGVGTWFHANPDFQSVTTRAALKTYDPGLASLLAEMFGDDPWRYTLPAQRTHSSHLRRFNPENAPRLEHSPELLETYREFTRNPDNDGGGEWVNLNPYDPSQLPYLINESIRTEDFMSLYFSNLTDRTVTLYRVRPDGSEIYSGNMIPGNFVEIGVYIGEILLVKDNTGENLVVFLVDNSVRGFIARAFVGNPDKISPPSVPVTGTLLAINQPPGVARAEFTIKPGTFALLTHRGKRVIRSKKAYNEYFHFGNGASTPQNPDFPNLARFFQNGGRIELVSHASFNPLPVNSSEPQWGDVVISEIMWGLDNGNSGKQYIELYNASAYTYTFTDADLHLRFSTADEEPYPDEIFAPHYNANVRIKVIDRVSNTTWKLPGKSGNTEKNEPLISMYRTIDYTTGNISDGTLAKSWQASTERVNLPAPSFGTPLPVTLSHFRAKHTDTGVVLRWITESELNNAGFNILRSDTKNGAFKVVNPQLIQGAGTTSERTQYTWTDTTAKPDTRYYYQIEDVSYTGVHQRLATTRLRGMVSPKGKRLIQWSDIKNR